MKIGIIGNGYVGGAVKAFMTVQQEQVLVFDRDPTRSTHSLEQVAQADLVFFCVPTPTKQGQQDLSAVSETLAALNRLTPGPTLPVVLKSTVLPGSCRRLQVQAPKLRLIFSPEFLTARTAERDFASPPRVVLGFGPEGSDEGVARLHRDWFPQTGLVLCSWEEAELLKYACNTFLAVRVGFWNDLYDLCQVLGVKYEHVVYPAHDVVARVVPGPCRVPGPDGQRGFGGACLPKDSAALLTLAESLDMDLGVLRQTVKANLRRRPETAT